MNCRDVLVLIPAYLDEEVTPSEKKLIHAHLADCPNCQQELEVIGGLRNRMSQHLKARAATVTPSPQAWSLLQASLPSRPSRMSVLENAIRSFSIPGWMSIGELSPQKIGFALLFIIVLFACAPPVWERVEPLITNIIAKRRITITAQIDWSAEPFRGTFEVTEGADVLGCEQGSFVDSEYIYDREPSAVLREFTCESGENSGTFTFALLLYIPGQRGGTPGPWSVDEATEEFFGLSGDGDWSIVENEDQGSGVMTLIGKIQYTPFTGVEGMRASGDSLWVWTESEIWHYLDSEWSLYAEIPIDGVQGMRVSGDSLMVWNEIEFWRYADNEWSFFMAVPESYVLEEGYSFDAHVGAVGYAFDTLLVADGHGLQYSKGDDWQIIPGEFHPWSIYADERTGNLWMSADYLYRWDGEEMTNVGRPPSATDITGDIAVTSDGILWIGSWNPWVPWIGSFASYEITNNAWEMVRPWRYDEDVPAQFMATTPDGGLWVILTDWSDDWEERQAAEKSYVEWALAYRDSATGKWAVYDDGLPEGYPFAMDADDDAVWLTQGTLGLPEDNVDGLFRFDGETWTQYLSGEIIRNIAIAPDGTIWYTYWGDDTLRQLR